MDAAPDELTGLLHLQELDTEIRRVRHRLDDLPEQRALDEIAGRDRVLQEQHDEVQAELSTVSGTQRQLEHEVELLRQRREAEQARLYGGEISNPRELQSLRAEIESTDRRVKEHEDDLLEVLEKAESLEIRSAKLTEQRDALADELARLTAARDDAAKELIAADAELSVARDQQRSQLSGPLIERYDSASERMGGLAVGALDNGMCTACRIELPMVEVNELLDGPPLATCPQCRRLMVITV